jgi:hypothetical protein
MPQDVIVPNALEQKTLAMIEQYTNGAITHTEFIYKIVQHWQNNATALHEEHESMFQS